ncbi:MAG: hypothetical protein ACK5QC_07395 [Bacteroidota bacterium]|jgi:hypothetical protein|nr:hypothetical protein [Bacteroidota bacterium]MCA6442128.1 hypothetical protein [Bacteroidota bacterium]
MNKIYTLHLNEKEIKLLLNALGKRPFEEVYELIEKVVTSTSNSNTLNISNKKKK